MKSRILLSALFLSLLAFGFTACKGKKSDAEVQTAVNTKLNSTAGWEGLSGTVNEGVVVLSGQCVDNDCKTNAAAEVAKIDGVKRVDNNVTVVVAAPVEINPDSILESAVADAVRGYDKVKAEVKEGVVTLRGEIKRSELQDLMQKLNTLKPRSVDNQLVIK